MTSNVTKPIEAEFFPKVRLKRGWSFPQAYPREDGHYLGLDLLPSLSTTTKKCSNQQRTTPLQKPLKSVAKTIQHRNQQRHKSNADLSLLIFQQRINPLLTVSNGFSVAKLATDSPLLILATDKSVAHFVNQQWILCC